MSKQGKVFFTFAMLAFLILGLARFIVGYWHETFWVPFLLMFAFFIAGVVKDWAVLKDLFTLRTTKHGMNMVTLIVVTTAALVCINILAVRYEKKFDWTSDKINSLSDQSVKAAQNLKADTEFIFLYRKDPQNPYPEAQAKIVERYRDVSKRISVKTYDALTRPDLAQKYEYSFGPFVMYAVQGEKKVKVEPISEESITRALLKLGREKKKVIYFTRGHGELLLDDKTPQGLSTLNEELTVTYDVKTFAFFETANKVPADAEAVVVMGPKQQFLDAEVTALRDYAKNGGHLLLALEPGQKHNLAQLTKTLGVEFNNDYVLDQQVSRNSPTLVLGVAFSKTSDITKAFYGGNAITVFEGASSLRRAPEVPEALTVEELVRSSPITATVPELKEEIVYRQSGPHTLGLTAKGKLGGEKEFLAVILGDADFASNRLVHNNFNRDLLANSLAWLASDAELITIRPREPKATQLNMQQGSFNFWLVLMLMIPLALFGSSIAVWLKRRLA